MSCTLPNAAKSKDADCTDCSQCGWNKQINKARRGRLRNMNRQELSQLMLEWAREELENERL